MLAIAPEYHDLDAASVSVTAPESHELLPHLFRLRHQRVMNCCRIDVGYGTRESRIVAASMLVNLPEDHKLVAAAVARLQ